MRARILGLRCIVFLLLQGRAQLFKGRYLGPTIGLLVDAPDVGRAAVNRDVGADAEPEVVPVLAEDNVAALVALHAVELSLGFLRHLSTLPPVGMTSSHCAR